MGLRHPFAAAAFAGLDQLAPAIFRCPYPMRKELMLLELRGLREIAGSAKCEDLSIDIGDSAAGAVELFLYDDDVVFVSGLDGRNVRLPGVAVMIAWTKPRAWQVWNAAV
jgi:hypothetical protein